MRMWMIDPSLLCDQHLLGEHNEIHKLCGLIDKYEHGHAVGRGFADGRYVELDHATQRHDALAAEMERRGMNHDSPLDWDNPLDKSGSVSLVESRGDLLKRCDNCSQRLLSA